MDPVDHFRFAPGIGPETAQSRLSAAYAALDEGKILRRTNALLRRRGIDPPMDVEYVAEPLVARRRDGLGIELGADIMIYDEFPEMDDCVAAFEDALWGLLLPRLEKELRRA